SASKRTVSTSVPSTGAPKVISGTACGILGMGATVLCPFCCFFIILIIPDGWGRLLTVARPDRVVEVGGEPLKQSVNLGCVVPAEGAGELQLPQVRPGELTVRPELRCLPFGGVICSRAGVLPRAEYTPHQVDEKPCDECRAGNRKDPVHPCGFS